MALNPKYIEIEWREKGWSVASVDIHLNAPMTVIALETTKPLAHVITDDPRFKCIEVGPTPILV